MKRIGLIAVALVFAATTLFVGGDGILGVDNAGYSKTSDQVACRYKKKKEKDSQLIEIA